jgi:hypothetical protein
VSRLFLILLITLLPLRGWSAERMAVYMAASEAASVAMRTADHGMPADCPMLMNVDTSNKSSGHRDNKSHAGCQACQLCMSLSASETHTLKIRPHKPVTAAVPRADRFVSAELLRAVKPPIS